MCSEYLLKVIGQNDSILYRRKTLKHVNHKNYTIWITLYVFTFIEPNVFDKYPFDKSVFLICFGLYDPNIGNYEKWHLHVCSVFDFWIWNV